MKLIIDIDEELYEAYKNRPPMLGDEGMDKIAQAIANGTPQGEMTDEVWKLTDEVWKLYKKHQSHLATYVLEFGEELADLLGKYNEGGAEE